MQLASGIAFEDNIGSSFTFGVKHIVLAWEEKKKKKREEINARVHEIGNCYESILS